jgi:hypothetical protein
MRLRAAWFGCGRALVLEHLIDAFDGHVDAGAKAARAGWEVEGF